MIPRIFINLDGGIIQQIICDSPIEIIVADFDVDGLEDDRVTKFKDDAGEDSMAHISHAIAGEEDKTISVDPEVVEVLFKNIKEAL